MRLERLEGNVRVFGGHNRWTCVNRHTVKFYAEGYYKPNDLLETDFGIFVACPARPCTFAPFIKTNIKKYTINDIAEFVKVSTRDGRFNWFYAPVPKLNQIQHVAFYNDGVFSLQSDMWYDYQPLRLRTTMARLPKKFVEAQISILPKCEVVNLYPQINDMFMLVGMLKYDSHNISQKRLASEEISPYYEFKNYCY